MLSVIIPSYKDPYLHKTIDDILVNAEGEIEIIAVLDGYWTSIKQDPRVRVLHFGRNRGMRNSINAGVAISRGEFLMRSDEHCKYQKGFDVAMTSVCQPNWIMTASRYFLDPEKWEIMDVEPYIYEKLVVRNNGSYEKFEGQRWRERAKERANIMLDETMSMQGSFWVMHRKWWDSVIVELQTVGYGPLIQDSHEMIFKTWQAGGKLMLNKNISFAHKHYSFKRTHNSGTEENPAECEKGYAYALSQWRDYYENIIRPKWGLSQS